MRSTSGVAALVVGGVLGLSAALAAQSPTAPEVAAQTPAQQPVVPAPVTPNRARTPGLISTTTPGPLIVEDSGAPYTTALGYQAAIHTTGTGNTASGFEALWSNTTGGGNTASGL